MVLEAGNCTGDSSVNPLTCVSHNFILALRVLQGCGSVVGTFGALMTITAVATHRKLRTVPNAYLVNLSVADLIVCSFLLPMSMYTVNNEADGLFCQLVGYPNIICLMVSVMNLSLVAVNRFVVVCKSRDLYARMYTVRNTALSIVGIWCLALLLFSPPFYGFGKYGYNTKFGACIFLSGDVETYWFVFAMADSTIMFPTLPVTLYCYVNIMLKFRESRRKVAGIPQEGSTIGPTKAAVTQDTSSEPSHSVDNGSVTKTTSLEPSAAAAAAAGGAGGGGGSNVRAFQKTKEKESSRKMRAVIKNMFVIWCTFLTFWMPLVLVYKIDYYGTCPNELYHILFAIAQCNSAVNFIIYCMLNKNFKDAYLNILTCKVFKKGQF